MGPSDREGAAKLTHGNRRDGSGSYDPGAQNPSQHPWLGGFSQSRDVSEQEYDPGSTVCSTTGCQQGDSFGNVTGGFAHHMHHDV